MKFFFDRETPKATAAQVKQVKHWIYQVLELDDEIPVSLSQLTCNEPDCPPIETVISVMTYPVQTYKVHKSIAEITYADIYQIIEHK